MNIRPKCGCNGAADLMFCCSGVADTAEIGDRATRQLHKEGVARMYCLAGIPAKAELIVNNTKAAARILVIDGCETDCARLTMEAGGFRGFLHLRVTDLGMEKTKSPVTGERIAKVAEQARNLLSAGEAQID
jgi:uncharacterized metal-binding protein